MAERRKAYIARTKEARIASGVSAEAVANYIGVDHSTYRSYETRRALKQEYIARFCEITRTSERWLVSNKGLREATVFEQMEMAMNNQVATLRGAIPSDD